MHLMFLVHVVFGRVTDLKVDLHHYVINIREKTETNAIITRGPATAGFFPPSNFV